MEQHNNHTYIEPSTFRKKEIVETNVRFHDEVPIFNILEFNIFGACNRSCDFCPVSDSTFYTNVYEGIEIELYEKIMRELSSVSYDGTILFSAFSEPLLNKKIVDLLKLTKLIVKNCKLEIVSNGDVILKNKKILRNLFDSGLDVISISIYDGPVEYKAFKKIIKENNFSEDQVILRRRYEQGSNFGMTVSNRAGLIDSNQYRSKDEEVIEINTLPLKKHCYYPFYQMVIDYNGDVLMCAHDWRKEKIVGNAKEENIIEIWKSKAIKEARLMLKEKNRTFLPCINCDVAGDVMGEPNFNAWVDYYAK